MAAKAVERACLQLVRRAGAWWIAGFEGTDEPCGPYATKAEAEEDRRGLERTYRFLPLVDTAAGRRYFTSFPKPTTKTRRASRKLSS